MTDPVLHITTEAEWLEAQRVGEVHPESLGREGFVHCSTEDQLPRTLLRHFSGVDHLVVLVIDVKRAGSELKWELSEGDRFPHLYGAVPVDSVIGVRPAR